MLIHQFYKLLMNSPQTGSLSSIWLCLTEAVVKCMDFWQGGLVHNEALRAVVVLIMPGSVLIVLGCFE